MSEVGWHSMLVLAASTEKLLPMSNLSDTTFANGERVAFKRGRIIVFSSLLEHDGEPPTNDIRISLGAICPHQGVHIA